MRGIRPSWRPAMLRPGPTRSSSSPSPPLTSSARGGPRAGFDLALLRAVTAVVDVPLIASGGAGPPADMVAAILEGGADAVLAASVFHRGIHSIASVKAALAAAGVPVRPGGEAA